MANILAIAGPNSRYKRPDVAPAGFFAGFWHGLIIPITFLISLIYPNVRIYETNNKGRRYDFGFILGASASFGGGGGQVMYERAGPPPISV
ncbi:MAG: hypothetical protein HY560_13215 [Gemmatimonadetes bacterium]|nr:hypothetical protein [Gemmatimonadota bacterium]